MNAVKIVADALSITKKRNLQIVNIYHNRLIKEIGLFCREDKALAGMVKVLSEMIEEGIIKEPQEIVNICFMSGYNFDKGLTTSAELN